MADPRIPDRWCSAPGRLGLHCSSPAKYVATGADGLQWFACDVLEHQAEAVTLEEWEAWYREKVLDEVGPG